MLVAGGFIPSLLHCPHQNRPTRASSASNKSTCLRKAQNYYRRPHPAKSPTRPVVLVFEAVGLVGWLSENERFCSSHLTPKKEGACPQYKVSSSLEPGSAVLTSRPPGTGMICTLQLASSPFLAVILGKAKTPGWWPVRMCTFRSNIHCPL